jgi:3-hydroxyacyl-CoA dehydrogenase
MRSRTMLPGAFPLPHRGSLRQLFSGILDSITLTSTPAAISTNARQLSCPAVQIESAFKSRFLNLHFINTESLYSLSDK